MWCRTVWKFQNEKNVNRPTLHFTFYEKLITRMQEKLILNSGKTFKQVNQAKSSKRFCNVRVTGRFRFCLKAVLLKVRNGRLVNAISFQWNEKKKTYKSKFIATATSGHNCCHAHQIKQSFWFFLWCFPFFPRKF